MYFLVTYHFRKLNFQAGYLQVGPGIHRFRHPADTDGLILRGSFAMVQFLLKGTTKTQRHQGEQVIGEKNTERTTAEVTGKR